MEEKFSTHCEEVSLPSAGLPYGGRIPSTISIRPFTNREMKGLYATSGEKGIETLMDNCINQRHDGWGADDLVAADRSMVLMRLRAITLGSKVPFNLVCGNCEEKISHVVDLDTIQVNSFASDMEYPIRVKLPDCGDEILFRLLTNAERKRIEHMLDDKAKRFPKFNKNSERVFYTYASCISFADGRPSGFQTMYDYYSNLSAMDATYLVFLNNQIEIGPVNSMEVTCPHCGSVQSFEFRITSEFFRPSFEKPAGLAIKTANPFGDDGKTDDAE